MEYDVEIFKRNYKILMKQRGMKPAEVEKKMDVGAGYFSRFEKKKNIPVPKVDTISRLAEVLGVSIDYILFGAVEEDEEEAATVNENQLLEFIKKVKFDSKQGKIVWEEGYILDNYFIYEIFYKEVFYFSNAQDFDEWLNKVITVWTRQEEDWKECPKLVYSRKFYADGELGYAGELLDPYYRGRMNDGNEILILKVNTRETPDGPDVEGWDIHILQEIRDFDEEGYETTRKQAIPIYSTAVVKGKKLLPETQDLIRHIKQSINDVYVSMDAKKFLNCYLQENQKEGGE